MSKTSDFGTISGLFVIIRSIRDFELSVTLVGFLIRFFNP